MFVKPFSSSIRPPHLFGDLVLAYNAYPQGLPDYTLSPKTTNALMQAKAPGLRSPQAGRDYLTVKVWPEKLGFGTTALVYPLPQDLLTISQDKELSDYDKNQKLLNALARQPQAVSIYDKSKQAIVASSSAWHALETLTDPDKQTDSTADKPSVLSSENEKPSHSPNPSPAASLRSSWVTPPALQAEASVPLNRTAVSTSVLPASSLPNSSVTPLSRPPLTPVPPSSVLPQPFRNFPPYGYYQSLLQS
jgi:hypothetical protein